MKKIFATILCMALSAQVVNAAVIKQNKNEEITVEGTVSKNASRDVLISVFGPFDVKTEYEDAAENTDKLYINSVNADDDLKYSFSYKPKVNNKFYAISVTNGGNQETASIYLAASDLLGSLISDINSTQDVETVFEKTEYEDVLVNNYSDFVALSSEQKLLVFDDINKFKKNGYTDFEEFEKIYLKTTAVQNCNNLLSAEDVMNITQQFIPIDGVKFYSEYLSYSDAEKLNVFERMISRNIPDIESFYKIFNESIFLEKIQNEEYSSNLTDFIIQNASDMGIDMASYTGVSNLVNAKLNKKYFKTIDDFKQAFDIAIGSQQSGGSGSSGGSTGGNSGGGGGGKTPNGIYVKPNVQQPASTLVFDDIDTVEWAKEAILALADKKIVSGKDEKKFCPQDMITREEFVKIAVGAFGIAEGDAECSFIDISEDKWYYDAVKTAVSANIISGISEEEFGTGMKITRQDICAILYRIGKSKGFELSASEDIFNDDADISDYAKESVYALKEAGVVSGLGDNIFGAKRNATRAEAAKMIYTMMEVLS